MGSGQGPHPWPRGRTRARAILYAPGSGSAFHTGTVPLTRCNQRLLRALGRPSTSCNEEVSNGQVPGASGGIVTAEVAHKPNEPEPGAVPATHRMQIKGVWRDALLVSEVATGLFGSDDRNACAQVRRLIRSGQLFARSTGAVHLVPVDAYLAYLRGETYP